MSTSDNQPRRNPPREKDKRPKSQASGHEQANQDNDMAGPTTSGQEDTMVFTETPLTIPESGEAVPSMPALPPSIPGTPRSVPGGFPEYNRSAEEDTIRINPPQLDLSFAENSGAQTIWTHTDSYTHPITDEQIPAIGLTSTPGRSRIRRETSRDPRALSAASSTSFNTQTSYQGPRTRASSLQALIQSVPQSISGSSPFQGDLAARHARDQLRLEQEAKVKRERIFQGIMGNMLEQQRTNIRDDIAIQTDPLHRILGTMDAHN